MTPHKLLIALGVVAAAVLGALAIVLLTWDRGATEEAQTKIDGEAELFRREGGGRHGHLRRVCLGVKHRHFKRNREPPPRMDCKELRILGW